MATLFTVQHELRASEDGSYRTYHPTGRVWLLLDGVKVGPTTFIQALRDHGDEPGMASWADELESWPPSSFIPPEE